MIQDLVVEKCLLLSANPISKMSYKLSIKKEFIRYKNFQYND